MTRWNTLAAMLAAAGVCSAQGPAPAPGAGPPMGMPRRPATPADLPPLDKVTEGYHQVNYAEEGKPSMWTIWVRDSDGGVLAGLPMGWNMPVAPKMVPRRYLFAMTIAGGAQYAGLQGGSVYAYWKQIDKRLALVEPNMEIRTGAGAEAEAASSVKRLFTDKVFLDTAIVAMQPNGAPVIDLKATILGNLGKFFPTGGRAARMGGAAGPGNLALAQLRTMKPFDGNVEISYEAPIADGSLRTYHISISDILALSTPNYKPREADPRVGYFTTSYVDFGKYAGSGETKTRYIHRWNFEKRDPSLKVSVPKKPLTYYVEHTVPVRYRPWVQKGIEHWNVAFEKVGIKSAIQVVLQDQGDKESMKKDPEDARYSFIRWLNNGIGTAIGPSRVNPETGEILDADVVLTDGWIRHFQTNYNEVLPKLALDGAGPETLAWLAARPQWDPRVRFAEPAERARMLADRSRGADLLHPSACACGGADCMAASQLGMAMDQLRMTMDMVDPNLFAANPEEDKLDGVPESFIGPLIADLVAHEVGHTLGLRHNFKASSIYTMAEIASDAVKGKKPFAGSVMDYIAPNIVLGKDGKPNGGDWTLIGVGPYDQWAIEFGYGPEANLKKVLSRVAEPELAFATDEDTMGPDPLARRYDFSKNPLEYANSQLDLAKFHRARLLDKFVKDGENWSRARQGYMATLAAQTKALGMMAAWVGGAHVNRDFKGDPKARDPIQVVPAAQQRAALDFVLANAFKDESFGLSTALLQKLTTDGFYGDGRFNMEEPAWPVHDKVLAVQSAVMTELLNPTTLRRVYDNEFRVAADQDALTLPELLDKVAGAAWAETDAAGLDAAKKGQFSARKPFVTSLRRNLQREHLDRLIDLATTDALGGAAGKTISVLASQQLRQVQQRLAGAAAVPVDPYTKAHFVDAEHRIKKALDAGMLLNAPAGGGGGMQFIILGKEPGQDAAGHPADCNCPLHRE